MISLKNLGVDLKKLAENLIQHFLKQAVRDGFFHGDMHQGNLFVDEKVISFLLILVLWVD